MFPSFFLRLIAASSILLAAGCEVSFEDISNDPEYSSIIGRNYISVVELSLLGIDVPPSYEEDVDYYLIDSKSPGWSGVELITEDILPVGSQIRVNTVERCTDCFLDSEPRIQFDVTLKGGTPIQGLPIKLRKYHFADSYFQLVSEET